MSNVTMFEEHRTFKVQRHIGKKITHGEATVIRIINDIPALQVEFTEDTKN